MQIESSGTYSYLVRAHVCYHSLCPHPPSPLRKQVTACHKPTASLAWLRIRAHEIGLLYIVWVCGTVAQFQEDFGSS